MTLWMGAVEACPLIDVFEQTNLTTQMSDRNFALATDGFGDSETLKASC